MSNPNEFDDLRAQIAALSERVRSLQDAVDRTGAESESTPLEVELPGAITRRNWMRAAAAAAVGGTAVALSGSDRVAAADTDSIKIGQTNNTGASRTVADHSGAAGADVSFLFQTRMGSGGAAVDFPAALAGWSGSDVRPHGVHGLSTNPTAEGVGVIGESKSPRGTGVRGIGWYGLIGSGTDYGVSGTGSKGSLLVNTSGSTPPTTAPVEALPGAIYGESTDPFSNTGSVWCAVSKSGEWRKLAGFDTAGSLHAIAPKRIYDSRAASPSPGRLVSGDDRTISVADGRDPVTGAVTDVDIVPAGAQAIAYNVTIDATEASGFLSVNPGFVVSSSASTINWSASDLILANGGIVGVDAGRNLQVFCGGGGSTHFIIDVTGYYL